MSSLPLVRCDIVGHDDTCFITHSITEGEVSTPLPPSLWDAGWSATLNMRSCYQIWFVGTNVNHSLLYILQNIRQD